MISHEYANLFPMMADADLGELADDIRKHGLRDAIVLLDGKILDGRNRHRACELAAVEPIFQDFTGDNALGFVISHNLHRRHLTESQRAMVAAKMANLSKGGPSGFHTDPSIDGSPLSQSKAQELLNVGESTITRAKKIQRLGAPELVAAVESGEVTVGAAYKVAELPHEEQREIVSQGADAIKAKAKEIRTEAAANKPEPDPEPGVVDGTNPANAMRFRMDQGETWYSYAIIQMDKIHAKDISREKVLKKMIAYCEERLKTNK